MSGATVHEYRNGLRYDTTIAGGVVGSAVFSPEPEPVYRYWLDRQWEPSPDRTAVFAMLNPSTADAAILDPTVRRCMGYARLWGCGRLIVVNLFALRATDPRTLGTVPDPVGPQNEHFIRAAAAIARQPQANWLGATGVVCAWGVSGKFAGPRHVDHGQAVIDWIKEAGAHTLALATTKQGHPRHPLYLPRLMTPQVWAPPA